MEMAIVRYGWKGSVRLLARTIHLNMLSFFWG
jgi:hypothetical protein